MDWNQWNPVVLIRKLSPEEIAEKTQRRPNVIQTIRTDGCLKYLDDGEEQKFKSPTDDELSGEENEHYDDSGWNSDKNKQLITKPTQKSQESKGRRKYESVSSDSIPSSTVSPPLIPSTLFCLVCSSKLPSDPTDFASHLLTHISSTEDDHHSCPIPSCGKKFSYRGSLVTHLKTHIYDQTHQCLSCSLTFKNDTQLSTHIKTEHPHDKMYHCQHCPSSYQFYASLRVHVTKNHYDNRCPCPKGCGAKFKDLKRMEKHLEKCVGKIEFHQCPSCPKQFKNKSRYSEHLRSHVKGGPGEYKCESCPKTFYNGTDFRRHVRTHTGEKPHICPECGMAFSENRFLTDHKILIHNFEQQQQHLQSAVCSLCGKSFNKRQSLVTHMLTHNEEKHYPCDVCGKIFKHPVSRRFHFRMEHEPSPGYTCPCCGKLFKLDYSLKKHLEKAHPNEQVEQMKEEQVEEEWEGIKKEEEWEGMEEEEEVELKWLKQENTIDEY